MSSSITHRLSGKRSCRLKRSFDALMRPISQFLRLVAVAGTSLLLSQPATADDEKLARDRMVRLIESQDAAFKEGRRPIRRTVIDALRQVPRHRFVPPELRVHAYEDRPLPIGNGQTISQPFIVALMTDLLEPDADDVILEVGTGSGYQAAVLSGLVRHVYTIEIVAPLAVQARKRLSVLGYRNVTVRQGDGYAGWPDLAPFDGIMVTAGADHIPIPLLSQLKPGGKLVMPVGRSRGEQQLVLIEKDGRGRLSREQVLPVRFVPLTGRAQQ